ncbi:MAG: protein-L-isoaspartate(D-aspartate) O-methyltransferase [Verrucomicrobiota bacterium]
MGAFLASWPQLMAELLDRHPDLTDPRVRQAMLAVPRHEFVPPQWAGQAYVDEALPLGRGQTVSQPYVVAWMTQWLEIKPGDRVLEIGTGSGYQTAVLAQLAGEVFSIELDPQLADSARRTLDRLGLSGVHLRVGDGARGWTESAPFQAILLTCAPAQLPSALLAQLADGGRLVAPCGPMGSQELRRYRRNGDHVTVERGMAVRFVPLRQPGEITRDVPG